MTGEELELRARVHAALEQNRLGRFDLEARASAHRALFDAVNEMFERFLEDPGDVWPDEVLALELQTRAAGEWCERMYGTDPWAEVRAERLVLFRTMRQSMPNSGLSSPFRSKNPRHVNAPLTCQRDGEVQECSDVNGLMTDTNWTERLAINIRHARKTAGLAQYQLAHQIGAARTQVVDWESGRRGSPGLAYLERIALATGRNVGWFYDEHDYEDEPA